MKRKRASNLDADSWFLFATAGSLRGLHCKIIILTRQLAYFGKLGHRKDIFQLSTIQCTSTKPVLSYGGIFMPWHISCSLWSYPKTCLLQTNTRLECWMPSRISSLVFLDFLMNSSFQWLVFWCLMMEIDSLSFCRIPALCGQSNREIENRQ